MHFCRNFCLVLLGLLSLLSYASSVPSSYSSSNAWPRASDDKYRIDKQRKYVDLMRDRIEIQTHPANRISIVDPAYELFSDPLLEKTDPLDWKDCLPPCSFGHKQQWTFFKAEVIVPRHWSCDAYSYDLQRGESILNDQSDYVSSNWPPTDPQGAAQKPTSPSSFLSPLQSLLNRRGNSDHLDVSACVDLRVSIDPNYIDNPVDDNFPAGPEGQIFINNERIAAIDREHSSIRSFYPFKAGQRYTISAVFFAGRCNVAHKLQFLGLAWRHIPTDLLWHDLRTAVELSEVIPESSGLKHVLLDSTDSALHMLDFRGESDGTWFHQSASAALDVFRTRSAPIFNTSPASVSSSTVVGIGHAHIDLAWLWPIKQTKHKVVRTFATQVMLLDGIHHSKRKQHSPPKGTSSSDPLQHSIDAQKASWTFFQSSPQAYLWVEQHAPDLFQHIKRLVTQEKRWEADGAFWCESDTNLPSGESLVRQLLYGKRYFSSRFDGLESQILFLPDTFGFSSALPQIMRLGNVSSFITSKISWSQYNRFPHDSFQWTGLDGSSVVAHFITTPPHWDQSDAAYYTYNSLMNAKEVKGAWDKYRQKRVGTEAMLTFGYGDGGGGPTNEMIETAARFASLASSDSSSFPKLKLSTAREAMRRLHEKKHQLPVYSGELYLEYHRGTYTTQAWLKKVNRRNEEALRDAEFLIVSAKLLKIDALQYGLYMYQLQGLWQDLLLMQFHDILPGSSVGEVYDEIRPMQERIASVTADIQRECAAAILHAYGHSSKDGVYLVANTLSFDRNEDIPLNNQQSLVGVTLPAGSLYIIAAPPPAIQTPTMAPLSTLSSSDHSFLFVSEDGKSVVNSLWNITFDDNGRISSLIDRKSNRQVLIPSGYGNMFELYEDRPMNYDAWDIDSYYVEHPLPAPRLKRTQVLSSDPFVSIVREFVIAREGTRTPSTIRQVFTLHPNSSLLEFHVHVDWQERNQLLKIAFEVDVRSSDASYETQFGHMKRPTHTNTLWESAKFEVVGHRFVDVSEDNFGVAVLNDCKYGWSRVVPNNRPGLPNSSQHRGSAIRLTLLRGASKPHKEADRGLHSFRYAFLPHHGSLQQANIPQQAMAFNAKPRVFSSTPPPTSSSPPLTELSASAFMEQQVAKKSVSSAVSVLKQIPIVACSNGIIVEALKPMEDGPESLVASDKYSFIIRVYESFGGRRRCSCTFGSAHITHVQAVDLLERDMSNADSLVQELDLVLTPTKRKVSFTLRAFQIASFRIDVAQL